MNKKIVELQKKLLALNEQFPDRSKFDAALACLGVHLELAKAAEESHPTLAIEQYRLAEECQGCIGNYATGSGEGLASMSALYDIMADRAELEERLAHKRKRTKEKISHLQEAIEIWKEIHRDPNLGELLPKKNIKSLEKQLRAWKAEIEKL